jgi:hypothetical protein
VISHSIKIELSIDEILLIMYFIRTSIPDNKNKEIVASKLYDRLDKIIAGI